MITIKKGNHTLQVSKNTYETMFKIMGYTIVDEKEEAKKEASSINDNIGVSNIEQNTIADADKTNQDKELDDFIDCFLQLHNSYNEFICIDRNIHIDFHNKYGYGNNTREQWEEYIKNNY